MRLSVVEALVLQGVAGEKGTLALGVQGVAVLARVARPPAVVAAAVVIEPAAVARDRLGGAQGSEVLQMRQTGALPAARRLGAACWKAVLGKVRSRWVALLVGRPLVVAAGVEVEGGAVAVAVAGEAILLLVWGGVL